MRTEAGSILAAFDDTATNVSRFFYCAKASKRDRDEGLEGMERNIVRVTNTGHSGNPSAQNGERTFIPRANHHPTVKPTSLMRYLCRLVTPTGGVILDPFMGSGSTLKAAILEGFGCVGIEKEAEYLEIAQRRIAEAQAQPSLLEVSE
jgi:site-specific DNA-methyltransferase (adenine-specific)